MHISCLICLYINCPSIDFSEGVDNVWEPDDEMDEEMQAAFEQFLEMGKTQSKDSNSTHSECSGWLHPQMYVVTCAHIYTQPFVILISLVLAVAMVL